jgi:hypothetical protein
MPRSWRILLSGLLLLAACSPSASSPASPSPSQASESASPSATPSDEPTPSESAPPGSDEAPPPGSEVFFCNQAFDGTATIDLAHVADVRVGSHPLADPAHDRIVFEFVEDGTPAYRLEPATPPFVQDGSGFPLTVNGSDFFRIILFGGTKLGDDGNPTYTGPTDFEPGFPQLVHLVEGGDFEATNTWYVGMEESPNGCFRAFELSDPSRIVIDLGY